MQLSVVVPSCIPLARQALPGPSMFQGYTPNPIATKWGLHQQPCNTAKTGGGIAQNIINGFVHAMESNSTLELMVLDVGAMVIPRTALEWKQRGADMGRETLIREVAGNLTIVYLSAWLGLLGAAAQNKAPLINPKGLDGQSFINLENYKAFVGATRQTLLENKDKLHELNAEQIREQVAAKLVHGLEDEFQHAVPDALKKVANLSWTQGESKNPEAVEKLIRLLAHSSDAPQHGPLAIETHLDKLAQATESQLSSVSVKADLTHSAKKALEKQLMQERYKLGKLARQGEAFLGEQLERLALASGLTEKTTLHGVTPETLDEVKRGFTLRKAVTDALSETGQKQISLSGRPTKELLLQIKRFMEQGFDRMVADAAHAEGQPLDFAKPLTTLLNKTTSQEALHSLEKQLLGKAQSNWNLLRYIPLKEDGLLRYVEKQKLLITGSALLLSTSVAVGATFFNAWWTRKLHHGEQYFPGDEPELSQQPRSIGSPRSKPEVALASQPSQATEAAVEDNAEPARSRLSAKAFEIPLPFLNKHYQPFHSKLATAPQKNNATQVPPKEKSSTETEHSSSKIMALSIDPPPQNVTAFSPILQPVAVASGLPHVSNTAQQMLRLTPSGLNTAAMSVQTGAFTS